MIISEENKFAFFRTPKTGSSTAHFFLTICRAWTERDFLSSIPQWGVGPGEGTHDYMRRTVHGTPQMAVDDGRITLDRLLECNSYAFVREPFARTVSAFYHLMGVRASPEAFDEMIESGKALENFATVLVPQKDYFFVDGVECVEAVPLDDFESGLRYVLSYISKATFPVIPMMNSRGLERDSKFNHEDWLTPTFTHFVKSHFGDDIEFYHKVISNESYKNT